MNIVPTGEVLVEILTHVCSDQNNLSVSSLLNICSSQSPNACRTVDGFQTVEEQQTQQVCPCMEIFPAPIALVSLCCTQHAVKLPLAAQCCLLLTERGA